MTYQEVVITLGREKNLLEQIFSLSQHHLKLVETGNPNGFEMFWPLLADLMEGLREAENDVDIALADLEQNYVLGSEELIEIERMTASISDLANRIADIDEKTIDHVNESMVRSMVG